MIIIDYQDKLAQFCEFNSLDSVHFIKMDSGSYELAQYLDSEPVFIHNDLFNNSSEGFIQKVKKASIVIVYTEGENIDYQGGNLIAKITPESDILVTNNLLNFVEQTLIEKNILKSQLYSIGNEVSKLIGQTDGQLQRVKKIYEENVPRRSQDFKGVKLSSKYLAGENNGGEFLDVFKANQKIYLIVSSTNSYLVSSSIMQIFAHYKMMDNYEGDTLVNLMEELKSEVSCLSQEESIEFGCFIMELDLHTLNARCLNSDKGRILSSKNSQLTFTYKELMSSSAEDIKSFKLEKGERLLISSPGFEANLKKSNVIISQETIEKEKSDLVELLDDIFFEIKKDVKKDFLAFDATALFLEVDKNVFTQA